MPFVSINLDALTRLAAIGLVNSVFLGIGMAAFAGLVVRLAGRRSSRNRFAIWYLALIGIAFLPWIGSAAAASSATHPTLSPGAVTLPAWLVYWLVGAWVSGSALGLAHVAHGLYRLRRLRATCKPIGPQYLDPVLREALAAIQSRRAVTLCVSNAVRVPSAIGYFRPMVVIPAWALAEIAPQELNAILLHELAHLRRYDDWTNLAQKLVRALFFFHPAVWFIDSRLTLEREMACDDAVLAANFAPRAYAESLVALAEKSFLRRGVQLAQAAVGHVQQMKLRLVEILRKDRQPTLSKWAKPALAMMCLASLVGAFVAASSPRWIAFSGTAGGQIAQAVYPAPEARLRPANLVSAATTRPRGTPLSLLQRKHGATKHVELERVGEFLQPAMDSRTAEPETVPPQLVLSGMAHRTVGVPVLLVFQGDAVGPNRVVWRVTVFHILPAQYVWFNGRSPNQI